MVPSKEGRREQLQAGGTCSAVVSALRHSPCDKGGCSLLTRCVCVASKGLGVESRFLQQRSWARYSSEIE